MIYIFISSDFICNFITFNKCDYWCCLLQSGFIFLHVHLCSIYRCVLRHQSALLTSCRNEELPRGSCRIYLTPARGKGQANVWLLTMLIHKGFSCRCKPFSMIDYGVHGTTYPRTHRGSLDPG